MITSSAAEVAQMVQGTLVGPDAPVLAVTADSRSVQPASLFVALRGERDGHDFTADAKAAGASCVMVERADAVPDGMAGVIVDDAWAALARLAGAVRGRVAPKVIAITGSVGKTTTKDLIAAACSSTRKTVAAAGSFNNELGVPLTLLDLVEDSAVLVVEIGSRGIGHVASLMPVVRPDVAVVTAVAGGAHLEQFGSVENVALAKSELVSGLRGRGIAILNADDPRVRAMAGVAPGDVLTFSASAQPDAHLRAAHVKLDASARASFVARTPDGEARITLPMAGQHHVGNALAALGAALSVGVPLDAAAAGISASVASRWRSEVTDVRGIRLLNDAYNANPTSTIAALDTLAALDVTGRRWAVLGLMAELGDTHDQGHLEVGRHAAARADVVIVVGPDADGIARGAREVGGTEVVTVADVGAANIALAARSGDAVLVKGSRAAGLEAVADVLIRGGGA